MLVIMFNTGHALPLVATRILRPRSNRGEGTGQPREVCGSWPQTRQIRDLDSVENRTWTESFHVHELSVSALSPRQQSRSRTIHVHVQATALIVRQHASAMGADCPQTVRSRELSTTANWSRPQSVREHGLAKSCPRRCIAVFMLPPVHFPVYVRIIPSHVLI